MKIPTLYLDTSIIGGYFDDEFRDATRELWRQMKAGKYRFVISPLVAQEAAGAPEEVRHLLTSTFTQDDLLPLSYEAEELAAAYMAQKVVPVKYADDALHVAIAVVNSVPVIVSWNFKHMVNYQREDGFNGVNLLQGYPSVRIISPLELVYDESEE